MTSAVLDYVRSAPAYEHVLLVSRREAHDTGESLIGAAQLRDLPHGKVRAIRAVAREYHAFRPDIVHAHSSIAGALTRMCRAVPPARTVYSPHCFAFERKDVSPPARSVYRGVERALASRTQAVAACSPREAELASALRGDRLKVAYVPNVVRVDPLTMPPLRSPKSVVGIGRLSQQKDPAFFRAVVQEVHRQDPSIHFKWIGGGDERELQRMRSAGVETTGWIPRVEVLRLLADSGIYLHTAAWEGAPISVLEAAAYALPIVGRQIGALQSLGLSNLEATPAGVATRVLDLQQPANYVRAVGESEKLAQRHHAVAQSVALIALYRQVQGLPEPPSAYADLRVG